MMIITDTPPPTVKRLLFFLWNNKLIILPVNEYHRKNLGISNNGLSKFYVAKQIDITFW